MHLLFLLIGISILMGLLVAFAAWDDAYYSYESAIFGFFTGFISTFLIIGILCTIISGIVEETNQSHPYVEEDHPEKVWHPVSLSDNYGTYGEINGGFFVISGFVETFQFYSWYEKTRSGGLVAKRISQRDGHIEIFEEPKGKRPAIEKYRLNEHCIPFKTDWTFGFASCGESGKKYAYKIRVPKGTVVHQFKLDTE